MKTESMKDYRSRGGIIKIIPIKKAKVLDYKKDNICRHMGTKNKTHAWWSESKELATKDTK